MQLILDFGNTQQKLALYEGNDLALTRNYPEISKALIARILDEHPGITAAILSSVIHHSEEITALLRQRIQLISLDENTPIPVINKYKSSSTLGKDRLAAAVAGAAAFPGENVLIINAGTALTFDFVNEMGEYLGGSISPGMQMRFNALHTFTDKLPLISYQETVGLLGSDTRTSILSGVVNGIVAEIEGISNGYLEIYPGLKIILSGGDLNYFVNRLKISIFALPNIVINGLQQILSFNVNKTK
ncbi:MAG: type III pantothenate kinase [Bacteroidales bacterium]|nr:type III pantothenate kinase [Bacteroidales bacterium]